MSTAKDLEDLTHVLQSVTVPEGFGPQIATLHHANRIKQLVAQIASDAEQAICADRQAGPYEAGEWAIDIESNKKWDWTKPDKGEPYALQEDVRQALTDEIHDDDQIAAVNQAFTMLTALAPIRPYQVRRTHLVELFGIDPKDHGSFEPYKTVKVTRTP